MAHNYYSQAYSWQEPRQPPSTPRRQNSFSDMLPRHLSTGPSGSITHNIWHDLNQELSQNVAREFPAHRHRAETFSQDSLEEIASIERDHNDESFDLAEKATNRGYMQRSSPFSLDYPPAEMSFIDWYPKGDATITYLNESGDIESISNLNPSYFEDRCPLLAQAFEPSRSGPKLYLEILTTATATPFIRYLYTGSYALPGRESNDVYEDVPTSVLLHCQIFRLADIYDLPELKQQSYVNVTRQCEFGCSSPDKPIDLCEAIKYAYQHLDEHANLIETIICYCVTSFLKHRLHDDFAFRTMAYDLRQFQQDLIRESMKRGFEDDTASAIINLPFKPYIPETYASREDITPGRGDVVYHFHASDEYDGASKKRKRQETAVPGASEIALALRLKHEASAVERKTEEHKSDAEDLEIGSSKRRASMARQESVSSESEFEIVAGPAPVVELSSDCDSDADAPVLIGRLDNENLDTQPTRLPIRTRSVASSMTLVEPGAHDIADSGSESDWTLV